MKCFVTGASGFIGANLVAELLARGHQVRALLRPHTDERGLNGLSYERVVGDLFDLGKLRQQMEGCDWCFHVAASYHLWMRDYGPMYRTNVEGTRNVLKAAGRAGCRKIVYTSTVGCVGLPRVVNGVLTPSDESKLVTPDQLNNDYKQSKFQAETMAMKLFKDEGLPIVIVNPSAPVGPNDVKPTPTGRIIVDFLNRRLPAYLETGLNWVHVHDVAVGHVLAAEKGRVGERYILGNKEGNWSMLQTLQQLSVLTQIPAPKYRLPYALALRIAEINELISFFTGKEPRAPIAGVRMARHKMWYDPSKAIRELGLPQTPVAQAFADAIQWFTANRSGKSLET